MMHLGLFIAGEGHHIAAWRDVAVPDTIANQEIGHYMELARKGEAACFDFLFTADTNAVFYGDEITEWSRTTQALRLEPLTLLSALAAVTERIGLVCTATTTYLEPFHVARLFASLDQISHGRAGWNLVTSSAPAEADNFSADAHPPSDERYARAAEFADVVLGLWDSWEEYAVLADKESGYYFDPAKLHRLDHEGAHFRVRGPLTVRRSSQGRPIIVQAGQSEEGRELAGATAEVVFTVQQDLEEARSYYQDIKARAIRHGRGADAVKVMPGLMPVVGASRAEAEAKLQRIQDFIQPELGLKRLALILGSDLTGYNIDGPLPDLPESTEQPGRQRVVIDMARRENLTIRQLYERVVGIRAHRVLTDTAENIADELQAWVEAGAADGFNILYLTYPEGIDEFIAGVIPILQSRGLFRTKYKGATLRDNLGLEVPANRYTAARNAKKQSIG
ncbi:MAG: LLM class flavin-dependent oxidoreductase [Pseudomonadota bacterium]|nr:LLM class flavin-dependent oxidoreductase [Pseudomonadota bacterium]